MSHTFDPSFLITELDNMPIDISEFKTFRLVQSSKIPATRRGFYDGQYNRDSSYFVDEMAGVVYNIGIATGAGLVVIDVDYKIINGVTHNGYTDLKEIESALGIDILNDDTYQVETPSGGLHIYYNYDVDDVDSGIQSSQTFAKNIDIKADGGYVVGAGSSDQRGEYKIKKLCKIKRLDYRLLNYILLLQSQKKGSRPLEENASPSETYCLINPQEVEAFIKYIDPNCNRETWRNVAFAIKSMNLPNGYDIFNDWSKGSVEKYDEKEVLKLWNSTKTSYGITYKTFYHIAKQYGAPVDKPFLSEDDNKMFDALAEDYEKNEMQKELELSGNLDLDKPLDLSLIEKHILYIPARPLPKTIDAWPHFAAIVKDIYNKAPMKYRDASILTAFHLLSSVFADKAKGSINLNLFSVLIMPTAAGKDYYIKRFEKYRNEVDMGMMSFSDGDKPEFHCIAPAASIQGYQRILKNLPTRTIIDEEIFHTFLTCASAKTTHDRLQQQIYAAMLKLYSSSTLRAISTKKAEDSSSEVENVKLSIFGTGVPADASNLFGSQSMVDQGTSNRFIKIYEPELHIEKRSDAPNYDPPLDDTVLNLLKIYFTLPNSCDDALLTFVASQDTIDAVNSCNAMIRSIDNDIQRSISARDVENALRLASIIACTEAVRLKQNVVRVSKQMFDFSFSFINKSIYSLINQSEEDMKKIMGMDVITLVDIINPKRRRFMKRATVKQYISNARSSGLTYASNLAIINYLKMNGAIKEKGDTYEFNFSIVK